MGLNSSSGAYAGLAKTVLLHQSTERSGTKCGPVGQIQGNSECLITMERMGLSTKNCHQSKAEERQTSDLGSKATIFSIKQI